MSKLGQEQFDSNFTKARYEFVVYGNPVGKGRPRFRRMGNFVRTYEPEETTSYENLVKLSFIQDNQDFKTIEKGKPILLAITLYYQIPKSISQKKTKLMLEQEILPVVKPDIDNVLKSICDGLNGVAWADDNQVVSVTIDKLYDTTPRAKVVIEEI